MILIPPKRICLSGGGIRAVAFLGALEVLEAKGMLRTVSEYIGVSAGALVAFGLCIGYTVQEMKRLCLEFDFGLLRCIDADSAMNFLEQYGLDQGENMQRFLESLLKQKQLPATLTFEEIATLQPALPRFRCFATDLTICEPREFSRTKTPTVSLIEALRATMSLPLYFTPIVDSVTGHFLTDGGVLHNYPMAFLQPEERCDSLGLMFTNEHAENKEIHDFFDFLHQMFACIYVPRTRKILSEAKHNTIVLPHGEYPNWNFEATKEEKIHLMEAAAEATKAYFNAFSVQKPLRRYSVS